jgi:hypothetical protein
MAEIVDIVETILSEINKEMTITNVVDNGNTIDLTVKTTKWATCDNEIEINGDTYKIIGLSISTNVIIVERVGHANTPSTGTFDLYCPDYLHGTIRGANKERVPHNENLSYPFVYLFEIIAQNVPAERDSIIAQAPDLRLFFLDQADFEDWYTDDHYENAIVPMRALADAFYDAANRSTLLSHIGARTFINHANWGVFADNNGHLTNLLSDNLSGVELQIQLPVFIDLTCNIC